MIVPFNIYIKKFLKNSPKFEFVWRILMPTIILILLGCITLYHTNDSYDNFSSTFYKQLIWIFVGISIFFFLQLVKVRFLQEYAFHFYLLLVILICLTYFMPIIGGSQRWIKLGIFTFQPSEIGKLIIVFCLARFISDNQLKMNGKLILFYSLLIVIFPGLLVFQQPDFGTAIVFIFVLFPMLYWGDVKLFYLFSIVAPLISIVAAFNLKIFSIWMMVLIIIIYINKPKIIIGTLSFIVNISFGIFSPFIWSSILYDHQRERILTLLNPMRDPQGAGYQIIQSITAIGSGGMLGKGLGLGTQTQLRYLPVRDTDFIISVIGEEMGLVGIFTILCLFFFLLYWIIVYAGIISNKFSSLCLIGFTSILFIHLIINMGMIIGLLPVTGLPVPFISYGGSFLVTCIFIIGLINNIINEHI